MTGTYRCDCYVSAHVNVIRSPYNAYGVSWSYREALRVPMPGMTYAQKTTHLPLQHKMTIADVVVQCRYVAREVVRILRMFYWTWCDVFCIELSEYDIPMSHYSSHIVIK